MPTRTKGDYEIGYGKPPRGCGFKRANPATPSGPSRGSAG
jgi:hypothetical protein